MWKNCFCFTKFLIQFGEKRGHWTPDFWYRMWDCQPMVSRILNSKNVYWISASFVANQKKIVSLVVVFLCQNHLICGKELKILGMEIHETMLWAACLTCSQLCFTIYEFSVCNLQMAKRLLIQNVGLPTHVFTNSQYCKLNFR